MWDKDPFIDPKLDVCRSVSSPSTRKIWTRRAKICWPNPGKTICCGECSLILSQSTRYSSCRFCSELTKACTHACAAINQLPRLCSQHGGHRGGLGPVLQHLYSAWLARRSDITPIFFCVCVCVCVCILVFFLFFSHCVTLLMLYFPVLSEQESIWNGRGNLCVSLTTHCRHI